MLISLAPGPRLDLSSGVYIGEYNVIVVGDENVPGAVKGSQLKIGERTYVGAQNNLRAAVARFGLDAPA
jgi:hypothetical protein